ncbi:restriction endonuclease [Lacipirellula sp.]|uniref:restriction endonuclease n=1 Tax=Lacipirellula sp. TaxID=2691419 RepID=UPI003D0C3E1F
MLAQKPALQRVYKIILANKGWITYGQIGKASACLPDGDTSAAGGRLPLLEVVSELLHLELIETVGISFDIFRIGTQFGAPELGRAAFEHKLRSELTLLKEARDWLRNSFLLAYDQHSCRTTETSIESFNQTHWDLHGPFYAGPFTRDSTLRKTQAREAFLALDFLGYRPFGKIDSEALMERYKSVAFRWRTIALVPVVVAPSFSNDAWNTLRRAGAIPVPLRDVFGRNVDELMKSLWKVLASTTSEEQVAQIEKTLSIASGTILGEGVVGNLKGALFELIVALAWRAAGYEVTLQKGIRSNEDGNEYEVDVVAIRGNECKLIECKGRHATYQESVAEVQRHFVNRCKAAADKYGWNVTGHYSTVEALFITSGQLDLDADAYATANAKSHGISCKVWKRQELLKWLDELSQTQLRDIIKRFYSTAEVISDDSEAPSDNKEYDK